MAEEQSIVAVDWGGTWFRAALIDRQGEALWQRREANPQGGTQADYLSLAREVLGDAIRAASDDGRGGAAGIGVAVAGPVEPESGVLYQPPNLASLDGVSLKAEWERDFGLPVVIGNDANLAALGEFYYGAGKEAAEQGSPVKTLFYVTVSTGIGGGVVERGRLFLGANGLTAEVGHTTVDSSGDAPQCNCGNRGCLEAAASGTAIARAARGLLAGGGYESSDLAAADPETLTSVMVFEAAGRGDALGQEVLSRALRGLSIGLTNALHLFNPDMIVLGGGVTEGLAALGALPRIRQGILDRSMSELHKDFRLVASGLGYNAGMLGAAAASWRQLDG